MIMPFRYDFVLNVRVFFYDNTRENGPACFVNVFQYITESVTESPSVGNYSITVVWRSQTIRISRKTGPERIARYNCRLQLFRAAPKPRGDIRIRRANVLMYDSCD